MNTLPEDIQDTIYKYKHQIEFNNVLEQLMCGVCYCGWCGARQWTWTDCCCMNKRDYRDIVRVGFTAFQSNYYANTG